MADRNGYGQSILQDDLSRCYLCGSSAGKIDRHEVFGAANRKKSKAYGLWVMLCHHPCHLEKAHGDGYVMDMLHRHGQLAAMTTYKMTIEEFVKWIGRSYL